MSFNGRCSCEALSFSAAMWPNGSSGEGSTFCLYEPSISKPPSKRDSSCWRTVNFSAGTVCCICFAGSVAVSYCSVVAHCTSVLTISASNPIKDDVAGALASLHIARNCCSTSGPAGSGTPYTFRCPRMKPLAWASQGSKSFTAKPARPSSPLEQ